MTQECDDIPTDGILPDDYEWGRERLDRFLQEFCGTGLAADESLLLDIAKRAASWQLSPSQWTRCGVGSYELNTPYGLLTVQRTFGWGVKRDGAPLTSVHNEKPIIFDKLEDAKTSALVHAKDRGVGRFVDGTCWA
jgi:hypothetical protein